jgi:CBS domain-containing protein
LTGPATSIEAETFVRLAFLQWKDRAMQLISEVMTREVRFVSPQETLEQAAQMMSDLNVGVLPVCDGDRLVGMITDRDITVRSASEGKAPGESSVEDAMSGDVQWCFEDQSLDEVIEQMADSLIRRVPVVSHDDAHRLIGIVALADLATRTDEAEKQEVEQLVEKVSSPAESERSQQASAASGGAKQAAGAVDISGEKFVGAPGAAIAPGAPAGGKETIGARPPDEVTGKGRQGRVGFAGDPGGLSPADMEESQRTAAGGAASGAESASAAGTGESTDAKRDTGAAGSGKDAAGASGGTTPGKEGGAKP